ncbi:hypothetical protein BGX31_010598 [Mortierella sp. GBA43]|nr:hypothetical protein BGX31_010598 [Mortierella sp. GBA43]
MSFATLPQDYNSASLFEAATSALQYAQQQQHHHQIQQQRRPQQPLPPTSSSHISTKALAITSCDTAGAHPPPLMGSAIVLANDSALHCFGGRLENRELTNCHYVLDVETCVWEVIYEASAPPGSASAPSTGASGTPDADAENDPEAETTTGEDPTHLSLSLTTDPIESSSATSDAASAMPSPRYFHTLNAFGTSLILFGGMGKVQDDDDSGVQESSTSSKSSASQGASAALSDLWVFDIITQRWQQKHPAMNPHFPKPRWAHMATIMDHYLIVIGGTDTQKDYVEDACVLDLRTWEWVSSIQNIGQCGSYRTVAATGPSKQSSTAAEPSAPSFPSASASSPQTSANIARPLSDSGPIDAMASISMVLSGRISAPNSVNSSAKEEEEMTNETQPAPPTEPKRKPLERLMSGELTPAFKTGKDVPSIYLYSNYNFQNLKRDFKVITPHYTHPTAGVAAITAPINPVPPPPPSFSVVEKSQSLTMMGADLPPGLRFPQGHVYQNHLIVTGTLIVPGKGPTLAIYAFNLGLYKWERLATDDVLDDGSWNRTLLHPATGTLLIFGNHKTNPEHDYANRLQHHDHIMLINLQAFGLYDRPIPSLPAMAQELGQELLSNPSLSDMHIASATGTLFGANSTILAARWPEFARLLLSPPYVTPLILVLPVPDEVVPLFLQYLYTGALPGTITASMADYLLILARRYELNGLYALTMDSLHQTVYSQPIRVYSTALIAGELGLQARAVGLAMKSIPNRRPSLSAKALSAASVPVTASFVLNATDGKELPPLPNPNPDPAGSGRNLSGLIRSVSNRTPSSPSPAATSFSQMQNLGQMNQSRESLSTDGGFVAEGLLQQYTGGRMIPLMTPMEEEDPGFLAPRSRQHSIRSSQQVLGSGVGSSSASTSSGGAGVGGGDSNYTTPLSSPGLVQGPNTTYNQNAAAYPFSLSPSKHYTSQPIGGYDDYQQDERTLMAKRRLQMQMQMDNEQPYPNQQQQQQQQQQQHHPQHQDYLMQQQLVQEQRQMREQEKSLLEQHRISQQRYMQQTQRGKIHQTTSAEIPSTAHLHNTLDYHFGAAGKQSGVPTRGRAFSDGNYEPTATTSSSSSGGGVGVSSSGSGKSGLIASLSKSDKDKEKKEKKEKEKEKKASKTKSKPIMSGEDLIRSAGF